MDRIIDFVAASLNLLIFVVVIVLVFVGIVKPLIKYLLEIQELNKRKQSSKSSNKVKNSPDNHNESSVDIIDELNNQQAETPQNTQTRSHRDTLSKLAQSDPDKAGELVKKWIHSDE